MEERQREGPCQHFCCVGENKLASSKLRQSETISHRPTESLTQVQCRATSVAKKSSSYSQLVYITNPNFCNGLRISKHFHNNLDHLFKVILHWILHIKTKILSFKCMEKYTRFKKMIYWNLFKSLQSIGSNPINRIILSPSSEP